MYALKLQHERMAAAKSQCILLLNWQHFSVSNYIARGKHILSISTRAEAFSDAFC